MTTNTPHETKPAQHVYVSPQTNNGKAITSMVLGLLSLTGFGLILGIPAIVLGIMALKKNEGEKGFSITGIISGAVSTLFSLVALFFVIIFVIMAAIFSDGATMHDDSQQPYNSKTPMYRSQSI